MVVVVVDEGAARGEVEAALALGRLGTRREGGAAPELGFARPELAAVEAFGESFPFSQSSSSPPVEVSSSSSNSRILMASGSPMPIFDFVVIFR